MHVPCQQWDAAGRPRCAAVPRGVRRPVRGGPGMLGGPVLLFDAVRTARRTHLALLRALYALLLLVVLFVVYTRWFGRDLAAGLAGIMDEQALPTSELARFA